MTCYSDFSDKHLFTLLIQGDESAFSEMYHRYKEALYFHANRSLSDHDEARDMVQEVFASLWAKRKSLPVPDSVDAYLYGAIRNRILNFIAHQKVVDRYIGSIDTFLSFTTSTTDHPLRHKELEGLLLREIERLPKKMKTVFEMSRKQGMTYKQIATELNISDQSVKKQMQRAIRILRLKIKLSLFLSLFW
ncbi:RNA polymerase sigma-70 factor [Sphingobacterium tabacisoli]|uniref:RNA polymerase sigma-70 factor n=1 Tax=Sphingobacterium tabacisoli TaxID=2044855 RepID=A0ABW5L6S5_9SPHI|nr:RNA polymerase sigma-70 factor [Sphingobacterium tabacisoli]